MSIGQPEDGLQVYLVGGAVRDALLGLPVRERDWVVIGATPDEMHARGFRAVGRDFPVFLHPHTQEEYALARTERKTGHGYHGFAFDTSPAVTLEEDLQRRDLTVNAIAQAPDGTLVDPCGGREDLAARRLRHVSAAFAEDPVRILRLARFAARLAPLGFVIAGETQALMRQMVAAGEADHLVPERVWKEAERALTSAERPSVFFDTLRSCGALARVMPELDALFGVPQRADYHPEIDAGLHTLMCADAAVREGYPLPVRVAALLHDFGKALTPPGEWPSHRGHELRGLAPIEAFCARLRLPNAQRELALAVCRDHLNVHRARELRPATLLRLLERLSAFRRGALFEQALQACVCDARGRLGLEHSPYPSVDYLQGAAAAARAVRAAEVVADGFEGAAIGEELAKRRARVLAAWKQRWDGPAS